MRSFTLSPVAMFSHGGGALGAADADADADALTTALVIATALALALGAEATLALGALDATTLALALAASLCTVAFRQPNITHKATAIFFMTDHDTIY